MRFMLRERGDVRIRLISVIAICTSSQFEIVTEALSGAGILGGGSHNTKTKRMRNAVHSCRCMRREKKKECGPVSCDRRDKELVKAVLYAAGVKKPKVRFYWTTW